MIARKPRQECAVQQSLHESPQFVVPILPGVCPPWSDTHQQPLTPQFVDTRSASSSFDRSRRRPGLHARVWAPSCRSRSSSSLKTIEGARWFGRWQPKALDITQDSSPMPRPGRGIASDSTAARHFPTRRPAFSRTGPHGPSMVVDPSAFQWSDDGWRGVSIEGQVIYEIHIGTFTPAGTFRAAIERLPDLVDIGFTVLEIMPLADFAGRFGWGYDGVNLFAPVAPVRHARRPSRASSTPRTGSSSASFSTSSTTTSGRTATISTKFAPRYFSGGATDWGDAINFDGDDAGPVREFFITNARYWIEEFHFDGLRLDATQQILRSLHAEHHHRGRRARSATPRAIATRSSSAENEPQRRSLVRPREEGGSALDALWNDDFHHAARVAADGSRRSVLQRISRRRAGVRFGREIWILVSGTVVSVAGEAPRHAGARPAAHALRRVHRQSRSDREHERRAASASGDEPGTVSRVDRAAAPPAEHADAVSGAGVSDVAAVLLFRRSHARSVEAGPRRAACERCRSSRASRRADGTACLPDPADPETFARCKLDWSERERNAAALALHKDLLRLRREDPVMRAQRMRGARRRRALRSRVRASLFRRVHGRSTCSSSISARGCTRRPIPEPLLAPSRGGSWRTVFSTESPKYGGWGTPPLETISDGWWIPAECAVLLTQTDATTPPR